MYKKHGGFKAFEKAVKEMKPDEVTEVVKASGLRGARRGGLSYGSEVVIYR